MRVMNCQELTTIDFCKPRVYELKIRAHSILFLLVCSITSVTMAEPVDYEKQIKPIFSSRCKACHGVLKQEGGLRLDTGALARKGGDSGKVIVPGKSAASPLLMRITSDDPAERMPQEGELLTAQQIAALRQWIDEGANSPADERAERDPREHWSFRPIVRPPVPQVPNAEWVRNPIDAFIAANHQRKGLSPQIEAARSELVRRL